MNLVEFIRGSNHIEGIVRAPTRDEVSAHVKLLTLDVVTVPDLVDFVFRICGRPLRERPGQDVAVGGHVPPPGGPAVRGQLEWLLARAHDGVDSPYRTHVEYETLHPFMDGNGRSGRALWAWQMQRAGQDPFALPFLHRWYYQSLDARQP